MAKKSDPCKITLNRKDGSKPQTFTYGEFINMLYDGGIDAFVREGLLDTNALSGNYPFSERKPRLAPQKDQDIKERAWVKRLKEDPGVPDQVKKSFSLGGESYITLPNSLTVEEANNMIDIMGIDEAYNHLVNQGGKAMPPVYRAVMSQIVIKKLNAMEDYERAVSVVEAAAALSTDLAQGLQAYSLWARLTPEGQLLATQRDLFSQRRNMIRMYKSTIEKITNSLNKIQKDTAKEVADKFSENSGPKPSIPSKPPTPKQYGSGNKNVTREKYEAAREALLAKLNKKAGQPSQRKESVPNEVFTIAAFHYEASEKNFEKFSKALIEDLGPSMEEYADMLFELSKIESEETAKAARIDELTEKLNKLIAPPATTDEEKAKEAENRKTKAQKIAEIASELDALTGTTDYTQMAEMYKQAKEVRDLTNAIERMTEDKEPGTTERKSKEERLREAANRLDEINGGTFYNDYVSDYIVQKKINDLSDKLDNMMAESTSSGPTPQTQRTSRNDKMRQMAAEVDTLNGNTEYSESVEEYIKERELQELEGKFNKAISIKPPKSSVAPASRQKKINQMALDLQAKTGDSSYVAAAMAFEKAKKDQADAKKAAREQQAKIKQAASEKGIINALSEMGTSMSDIIRSHYSGVNATKERLIELLIAKAGLSGQAATNLADKISQEFDRIATDRKKKAVETMLRRKAMLATPKKKKSEIEIFVERSNMGMLTEAQASEDVADIMGFPGKLSANDAAKIKELADKVQEATSEREKERAMYDLVKYRASMNDFSWADSVQSIWMASILSGHKTQATNIIANSINAAFLYANALSRNPLGILPITKGLLVGLKRGFFEGLDVWRTGRSPLRGGQVEIPDTLETHPLKGVLKPLNNYKYIRRFMVAADTFTYEGLKQMRAHQLSYIYALENKDKFPDMSARKAANKVLNRSDTALKAARLQAETEKNEKIDAAREKLRDGKINQKEFEFIEKYANADERFRIHEILEESRDQDLMSAAHRYAARGTYNHPPEGFLGVLAKGLNQSILSKAKFTRYFVPFVNIITNVTNETLNYSPIGAIRAFKESGTLTPLAISEIREMDSNERTDLYLKAAWGTALSAMLMYLSGDDDDEPTVEITANGFNNYKENGILENSGWQANSFRVKNPFTGQYTGWFSYRYTPLYFMMSFIGGARDQVKYKGEEPGDSEWAKWGVGLAVAGKSMFESTYLNSLEDFMNLIHGSTSSPENFGERIVDWAAKTGAGFLPNMYTQAAQQIENWMDIPAKEIRETYMGRILRDIPIARDRYFNRVGVFGDDLPPDTDLIYSIREPKDSDDIADMLVRRHVSITTPARDGEFVDINHEKIPMEHDQFYNFAKIRGHFIKFFFHNEKQNLMADWEKMTDAEFKQEWADIESIATTVAKSYCDKYIPLGTKDYWSYIVKNYPIETFKLYKMTPQEHAPFGFNLKETLAEIGMKHLLYSTKEMGNNIEDRVIQSINKNRERRMYESMLDTLPEAERAVIFRLLERHKKDTVPAYQEVVPPSPAPEPTYTPPPASSPEPAPATGGDRKFNANGKTYTISAAQVKSFLKTFPDAVEVNE